MIDSEPQPQPNSLKPGEAAPDAFARIERAIFGTADTLFTTVGNIFDKSATDTANSTYDKDLRPAISQDRRIFYVIGLFALLIDQVTKWIVEATIPLNTSADFDLLLPYFRFTHVANTGAAFGLFPDASLFFVFLAIILAFLIAQFNYTLPTRSRTMRITLGVIFGGALGNLVDRFRIGHVTDFFNFNLRSLYDLPILDWPVFNVADACVVFGVLFLVYQMFQEQQRIFEQEQQQKIETAVKQQLPHLLTQLETEGKIRILANGHNEHQLPPFLAQRSTQWVPETTTTQLTDTTHE